VTIIFGVSWRDRAFNVSEERKVVGKVNVGINNSEVPYVIAKVSLELWTGKESLSDQTTAATIITRLCISVVVPDVSTPTFFVSPVYGRHRRCRRPTKA